MKIGILGTGMVGNALGTKLVQVGHEVTMGSRSANNEAAQKWAGALGQRARAATFRDAAEFGEIVISCTGGVYSLEALESVGAEPSTEKFSSMSLTRSSKTKTDR
jgi:predicted dinucleotide-binding enzyme